MSAYSKKVSYLHYVYSKKDLNTDIKKDINKSHLALCEDISSPQIYIFNI